MEHFLGSKLIKKIIIFLLLSTSFSQLITFNLENICSFPKCLVQYYSCWCDLNTYIDALYHIKPISNNVVGYSPIHPAKMGIHSMLLCQQFMNR